MRSLACVGLLLAVAGCGSGSMVKDAVADHDTDAARGSDVDATVVVDADADVASDAVADVTGHADADVASDADATGPGDAAAGADMAFDPDAPVGSGGSCGQVRPCGGDVVGTWKVAGVCFLDQSLYDLMDLTSRGCRSAKLALTGLRSEGTATYAADKTYHSSYHTTRTLRLTWPLTCVGQGEIQTCADVEARFRTDPMYQSVSCATTAAACVCALVSESDDTDFGTYSTIGFIVNYDSQVNISGPGDEYCVQGNELHLMMLDHDHPNPDGDPIQGALVLTKQ